MVNGGSRHCATTIHHLSFYIIPRDDLRLVHYSPSLRNCWVIQELVFLGLRRPQAHKSQLAARSELTCVVASWSVSLSSSCWRPLSWLRRVRGQPSLSTSWHRSS